MNTHLPPRALTQLRALATEWADHYEWNETDDPANDTGGENAAYNACGAALHEKLDELLDFPRCTGCGQHLHRHPTEDAWLSRGARFAPPHICWPSGVPHAPKEN